MIRDQYKRELDALRPPVVAPVGMLSLEYTAEYIETILSPIDHLASIGDFEFNYCEGETLSFVLEKWVGTETLKDIMKNKENWPREMYMPGIASHLQVGPTSSIL
jgi:hypothetical protein